MKNKFKENHVTEDGQIVEGRWFVDNSKTTYAHKDAFQFIKKDPRHPRIQFIGGVLKNITIRNNVVQAPKAHLQPFFSSDGGFRNLKAYNNTVRTLSTHHLSFSGVISGDFKNNFAFVIDKKSKNLVMKPATILLKPMRICGKLKKEKEIFISSFKKKSDNYKPVKCDFGLKDERFIKKKGVIYLEDFDLTGFQNAMIKAKESHRDIESLVLNGKRIAQSFGKVKTV